MTGRHEERKASAGPMRPLEAGELAATAGGGAERPPQGLRIRDFAADDCGATVAIANRVYPEYPETTAEWRYADEHRDPKCLFKRFVAEIEGQIVGFASFGNVVHMYDARKFWVDVTVDPPFQNRRIGSAMYDHLTAALEPHQPLKLWSGAREDYASSVHFLTVRGFREVQREWESRLDVDGFDHAKWADRVAAVEASGIGIVTLAELASDPERNRKLYELVETVAADVPSPDDYTSGSFELFEDRLRTSPNLIPEGYLVAVDGDRYVALSNLWRSQARDDELYVGLTGTLREYRRQGLATALKLKAVQFAARNGVRVLKTWNATSNVGMLRLNDALGFVRQPAWINYAKDVGGADQAS